MRAGGCTTSAASAPALPRRSWPTCADASAGWPAPRRRGCCWPATRPTRRSTGCSRSWWGKCSTSAGPAMVGYATPLGSACARTREPRRWSATSRTRRPPACPTSPRPPPLAGSSMRRSRCAAPQRVGGTEITHADRELWPGITKQDLAEYWTKVAGRALPGIAGRPLALLPLPRWHHRPELLPEARQSRHAVGHPGGQCRGPALSGHP